jgi:hypothetical protein
VHHPDAFLSSDQDRHHFFMKYYYNYYYYSSYYSFVNIINNQQMKIDDVIMLLLLHQKEEDEEEEKHSRYKKIFYKRLSAYERQRRLRRIPRVALHSPINCAWRQLYNSDNDAALITLTGFDFRTFKWLARIFVPFYNSYTPHVSSDGRIVRLEDPRGKRRLMRGIDCLALCLAWTRTKGSTITLQMIFGMTHTSVGIYLKFSRRILIKCLLKHPYATINIPDEQKSLWLLR